MVSKIPSNGLENDAVIETSIADNSITNSKLADNAVDTAEIVDDAVTNAKILDGAIDYDKLAAAIIATQLDAETGTATDKLMTPERTKQAIDENISNRRFQSSDQSIVRSTINTIAHGLGSTPDNVTVFIRCTTAEFGYSVGDIYQLGPWKITSSSPTSNGIGIIVDATNITTLVGNQISIPNKSLPDNRENIDVDNWDYYVIAKI